MHITPFSVLEKGVSGSRRPLSPNGPHTCRPRRRHVKRSPACSKVLASCSPRRCLDFWSRLPTLSFHHPSLQTAENSKLTLYVPIVYRIASDRSMERRNSGRIVRPVIRSSQFMHNACTRAEVYPAPCHRRRCGWLSASAASISGRPMRASHGKVRNRLDTQEKGRVRPRSRIWQCSDDSC